MPSLPDGLFNLLETKVLAARNAAEKAAQNVVAYLGVEQERVISVLDEEQRRLRIALRARSRQLGSTQLLIEEIAYEQWHRMLFARFLIENDLLIHPELQVSVSMQELEELAPEEGADDAWRLAARYASQMLPGIFKLEDPCAQVRLTPNDHHTLENILLEIPALVFTCDDSLGWMYQFWQSKKKDEVNASERKIGGADLAPVTQLFTEDYMVRFLLENSLGAWWAARHPNSPLLKEWKYLRFKEDGTPAAGNFPGWPALVAELTVMDPCCGSGHFLVVAFDMLRKMRMEEEGLDTADAGDAVLRDNIFGLELDARCTQISAFSLMLIAWKTASNRKLPIPNVKCTGIPVMGQLDSWMKLAGDDKRIQAGIERLYRLFCNAPDLGSLINPAALPVIDQMFIADYNQLVPVLEKVLKNETIKNDPIAEILGIIVEDVAKSARLLVQKYTLVITNVPFLTQGKQNDILSNFCKDNYNDAKRDLATVFLKRLEAFSEADCSYALVMPQDWRFLKQFNELRKKHLLSQKWDLVVNLGNKAFRTPLYDYNIGLFIFTNKPPEKDNQIIGFDISNSKLIREKISALKIDELHMINQSKQLNNPNGRIILEDIDIKSMLSDFAIAVSGMSPGDRNLFYREFWEIPEITADWDFSQSSVSKTNFYGGRSEIVFYQQGRGVMYELAQSVKHLNHAAQNWQRGQSVWGLKGISVRQLGTLPCSIYTGDKFDNNVKVIIPKDPKSFSAIWSFCSSKEFYKNVRKLNQKTSVDPSYLKEIPFDFDYWQKVACQTGPIPEPYSDDPSQWLFNGNPKGSEKPLQVASIRLLGYHWPQQLPDSLNNLFDNDGIVCLPAVNGKPLAMERLRTLLAAAYGNEWSNAKQEELLAAVGYSGKDLAEWLRDGFFEQHCRLFHNRPFIWHIWDGRKDGFAALLNYHKLDRANLEKLIYTDLGSWINDRKMDLERGAAGAEGRLLAARELQKKLILILKGEPPYDIYVRWKPLHEQPVGWEPDLNDGVRLNIRPFVTAGVLRAKFTINWNKDRGKNPDGSERINDLHFTHEQKLEARRKAGTPV